MILDPKKVLDWEHPEDRDFYIWESMNALRFKFLGQGKERMTFLSPNHRYVLKFGSDPYGHNACLREANRWKRYWNNPIRDNIVLAPCRMYKECALMMWAMTELYGDTLGCDNARQVLGHEKVFFDTHNLVDSDQVGLMRNGKIAVYDYADDF